MLLQRDCLSGLEPSIFTFEVENFFKMLINLKIISLLHVIKNTFLIKNILSQNKQKLSKSSGVYNFVNLAGASAFAFDHCPITCHDSFGKPMRMILKRQTQYC
jgi:hypothetical protein